MTRESTSGVSFRAAQTAWARTIIRGLYDSGATHFVVSPGSRSTPLVAALQRLGIRFDLVVDERSAGFLALGRGKLTDVPSVLVCTSGSAPFHYFPALIEADESRAPLIVLSADRPPEQQGNRSFQTTEQRQLFGTRVRWFDDLGVAEASEPALLGVRRKVAQAVAVASGPIPGPVHLNVPFRKPLEPENADVPAERALQALPRCQHFAALALPASHAVDAVLHWLAVAKRPLLVFGPHAPQRAPRREALHAFLEQSGWPLFAETTSNVVAHIEAGSAIPPTGRGFDTVLRALDRPALATLRADYLPDAVLQIGDVPTSASWLRALREVPHVVLADGRHPDPLNRAQIIAGGDASAWLRALTGKVPRAEEAFAQRWERALALADAAARAMAADDNQPLAHEGQAVRALGDALSTTDLLVVGNSLPVRLVDNFTSIQVPCLSQRGHNGIDGLIAGAAGAAGGRAGHTVLLLGDISFLHDVGSLKCVKDLAPRLTIVVLNNAGGRLFEQLPVASAGLDLAPWLTPHASDLSQIASAFGLASCRVDTAPALAEAVSRARSSFLPAVVEVLVPPSATQAAYRTLVDRVSAALAEPT